MNLCTLALLLAVAADVDSSPALPTSLAHEEPQAGPESPDWRVGVRLNIWSSFGEPGNDIIGGSLYGSYRLKDLINEDWWLTLEAYAGAFDFENPGDQLLGTSGTPTADAKISMQAVSVTAEWHLLGKESPLDVYVGAGFGLVFLSDGDAEELPQVDVEVSGGAGFELHLTAGAALRVYGPVYVTVDLRLMEVLAKLDVEDRVSGRDGSLDSWEAAGFSLGLELRF